MAHNTYVVCGYKSWNRDVFDEELSDLPGMWHFIGSKEDLTMERLRQLQPRYIFLLHWSWAVPPEILEAFPCINFHMTDLPYGRGGSPLQHLILRGHTETKLTAHRMTGELEDGPVYLKEPMHLDGSAEEILRRANEVMIRMIQDIVRDDPIPQAQQGNVVIFERRMPADSEIPDGLTPATLYDFIRMLDAEGYPHAFLRKNGQRYEFRNARLHDGELSADVRVVPDNPT